MKTRLLCLLACLMLGISAFAQKENLPAPNKNRGEKLMTALQNRQATREFGSRKLTRQDLSDVLWAAMGKNRADGRRTAPTAMNKQEITLYVLDATGAYLYDPSANTITLQAKGDFRNVLASGQDYVNQAPAVLLMVADVSAFGKMDDPKARMWVGADAGIVSQNINLFCAANGWNTVTRAFMDADQLKKILKLKDTQLPVLNNPIGFKK